MTRKILIVIGIVLVAVGLVTMPKSISSSHALNEQIHRLIKNCSDLAAEVQRAQKIAEESQAAAKEAINMANVYKGGMERMSRMADDFAYQYMRAAHTNAAVYYCTNDPLYPDGSCWHVFDTNDLPKIKNL